MPKKIAQKYLEEIFDLATKIKNNNDDDEIPF